MQSVFHSVLLVAMAIVVVVVVVVVVGSGSVFLVCLELLSMCLQCLGKMAFFFSVVLHTVALLFRNASTNAIQYQVIYKSNVAFTNCCWLHSLKWKFHEVTIQTSEGSMRRYRISQGKESHQ